MRKPGRNDPCPCGSGKKYKKCCYPNPQSETDVPLLLDSASAQLDRVMQRNWRRFKEQVGDYTREFYSLYTRNLEQKTLAGKAAADVLLGFLKPLEEELASICRGHSSLYWLNYLRRLPNKLFFAGGDLPTTVANLRALCEIAVLKYGSYEAHDWVEEKVAGIIAKDVSAFNFALGNQDALALFNLVQLSFHHYHVGRMLARVGKGARLIAEREWFETKFDDENLERLAVLYDHRVAKYSTFFGNLGILGGPKTREFVPTGDFLESWPPGKDRSFDITEHLPAVLPIDPETVSHETLRRRYYGKTYSLTHTNYLRTLIHAPGLLNALKLTDELRNAFEQANNSLRPEEILYCIWLADAAQIDSITEEPSIWKLLRLTGLCLWKLPILRTRLLQLADSTDFNALFPSEFLKNIRQHKGELIDRFINNYSFAPGIRSTLSLRGPYHGHFILQATGDFAIVDFTKIGSLLAQATWFVIEKKATDQIKNKQFERDLEKLLSSQYGVPRFAFPSGYKLEDSKGQFAEVDVSPIIDKCLIWVECKTGTYSPEVHRGEHRAVRNRWAKIATDDDSWLNQAERAARQAARRKAWANGRLPEQIEWILPVVCSSTVEYIAEPARRYFLSAESPQVIPRICTPEELGEFLREWDWDKIRHKPFLVPVPREAPAPATFGPQEWREEGLASFMRGRYDDALVCFQASLRLDSSNARAWDNKATALGKLGKFEEALKCHKRAVELSPNDPIILNNMATILEEYVKDHRGAIRLLEKALQLNPDLAVAWMNKGIALVRLGDYPDAIASLEEARRLDPDEPRIAVKLALAQCIDLIGRGDLEGALMKCEEVLRVDPREPRGWRYKGKVLHRLGEYDKAITCFDEALRLDSSHVPSMLDKAVVLGVIGDYQGVIGCSEAALRLEPRLARAWANKGSALHCLGDIDGALASVDKAIEIDRKDALIWINKAELLHALGRETEAEQCRMEAEKLREEPLGSSELGIYG